MRSRWAFLGGLLVAGAASALLWLALRDTRPARIVLIVVDTLRADSLACYGAAVSTPNIDRLAARGQRFTNAVASFHQTTMSMAALFTGRLPSIETGRREATLDWNGRTWCGMARFRQDPSSPSCVPPLVPTLAEAMRAAGYATVGVVSNELLFKPAGYDRGFDAWVEVGWHPPSAGVGLSRLAVVSRSAAAVNRAVLNALRHRRDERLFLYVHYMDVHDWYVPGDPTLPYEQVANYAKAVTAVDRGVGTLLEQLDRQGLLADATVVLTADHGESLGEPHLVPGMMAHFGNPSHESVLRIPLVIAPASHEDSGRFVRTQDLFGVLQRLAGARGDLPASEPEVAPDELFVGERLFQTYRRGSWKSVRPRAGGAAVLFDLARDPEEMHDVAADHPDVAAAQMRRVDELTTRLAARRDDATTLSDEDRARLRALGYLE